MGGEGGDDAADEDEDGAPPVVAVVVVPELDAGHQGYEMGEKYEGFAGGDAYAVSGVKMDDGSGEEDEHAGEECDIEALVDLAHC